MLRLRRLVAVGVALITGAGCRTMSDAGRRVLPPAPPNAPHYSDYEPENPYRPSKEGGVFERSVFISPSEGAYIVEVRDFLVSPADPNAPVPLAGAALLEVRQGSGAARVRGEEIALRPGTVFMVDQEEQLVITAHNEPLALRSWIIKPGGSR